MMGWLTHHSEVQKDCVPVPPVVLGLWHDMNFLHLIMKG